MMATAGRSPEAELILACARTRLDEASLARARAALARGIDWDVLLRTAELQGVAPLLHASLSRLGPGTLPPAPAERLRRTCRGIAQLNLRLAAELRRLLEQFEARDIPVIPFKGPVLAVAAYRNLALRRFSDLDVLVRPRDLGPARELLASLGYSLGYHDRDLEYHFVDQARQITVDLHQRIASSYFPAPDDFGALWERLQPVAVGGGVVHGLSAADSAFGLCVHLAKDCRVWKERLSEVCDVAELVAADPDLPWDRVLDEARAVGGERIVLLALWLAKDLLDSPVPEPARARLAADVHVSRLGGIVRERLLRQLDGSLEYLPYHRDTLIEDSRFHLGMRERRGDKVRYIRDLIRNRVARLLTPTERDRRFLRLPRALDLLYYVVRPIRVTRDRLREPSGDRRPDSTFTFGPRRTQ